MDELELSYLEECAIRNEIHDIVDGFTENDFEIAFRETRTIIEKIERICTPDVESQIIGRSTNRKHPCWKDPDLNIILPYIVEILYPDVSEYYKKMELVRMISDSCVEEHYDEAKRLYHTRRLGLNIKNDTREKEILNECINSIALSGGTIWHFKSR